MMSRPSRARTAPRAQAVKVAAGDVGLAFRRAEKAVEAGHVSLKQGAAVGADPGDLVGLAFRTAASLTSPVPAGKAVAMVFRADPTSPVRGAKAPVMAAQTSPASRAAMAVAEVSRASHADKAEKAVKVLPMQA